jgi:hypothetical protein
LDQTACRELREEAGVEDIYLEQLYLFSDLDRDPRGWILTSAYLALADQNRLMLRAGDDAASAAWFKVFLTCDESHLWHLELIGQNEVLRATLVEAPQRPGLSRLRSRKAVLFLSRLRSREAVLCLSFLRSRKATKRESIV